MTDNKNRVVVTGLGMICAIGNNVEETWANAMKSVSGIKETHTVDTKDCYSVVAAEVNDPSLEEQSTAKDTDRVARLCLKAANEAMKDAGYTIDKKEADRVSVIMGSCVGGVNSVEHYYRNGRPASDIPKMTIAPIANQVALELGAEGVVTNIANACAAGTMSISYASDLIRAGKCDVAVAGGADAFASVPYAGFLSLHALDETGCHPFNRCHGITLGEGSGALIVESYEHAVARGAKIYCEVLGSGISSDAHHITSPRDDGEGQMNCINWGIANSGIDAAEVGYVNAHGTGTTKNDMSEFLSIHTIFDDTAADLSVSSTKAMTGHCLGAAGSIEAVFSIKALTENMVPPTLGYEEGDMETLAERSGKIDFRANVAKAKELKTVMNNSFAFGGNNASIIFSKEQGNVQNKNDGERIFITGLGVLSTKGNTVDAVVSALEKEEKPESTSAQLTYGNDDYASADLKMAFYRKLDKFSQMQCISGGNALKDADITVTDENATSVGISVGTAMGPISTICNFQEALIEGGNVAGSAFKFPNTVYNAAGGYLSICKGIKGYNVTVTNGTQSGLQSIAYATQVLRDKRAKIMLATGTDENSEIINEFYEKLGNIAPSVSGVYEEGKGIALSEGSTTIVMETESSMKARNAKAYAEVLGYGMAHVSAKVGEITGSDNGCERAIRAALADAKLEASDIDVIFGFGNGNSEVNAIELKAYTDVFAGKLPVVNIKDTFGEGRAATATLSAAFAALMLGNKTEIKKAYFAENGRMVKKAADIKNATKALVVSCGNGGNYTAVVISK